MSVVWYISITMFFIHFSVSVLLLFPRTLRARGREECSELARNKPQQPGDKAEKGQKNKKEESEEIDKEMLCGIIGFICIHFLPLFYYRVKMFERT